MLIRADPHRVFAHMVNILYIYLPDPVCQITTAMEALQTIERFGELLKEEPISTLEDEWVLPGSCVLEATSPFFGYYHDAPMTDMQPYVYLVLDHHVTVGDIARISARIQFGTNYPFDAAVGSISLFAKTMPVIRLRDIGNFDRIKSLQELFLAEGVRFKSRQRSISEQMALIRLYKFVYLKPLDDSMYLDQRDENKAYFVLPRHIGWEAFKELTKQVKYDTDLLFFDAAQAMIYQNATVVELARIYRENLTPDKLSAIRDRYLRLLA